MTESEEKYRDILNLPHHRSKVHPQMSIYDRAAQFSPFAALTGHEAAIKETARLTEEQVELDEDKQKFRDYERTIVLEDGTDIECDRIVEIRGI